MRTYIRNFLGVVAESPFNSLIQHGEQVVKATQKLPVLIDAYCKKDYQKFEMLVETIKNEERKADDLKLEIRAKLPRNVFLPVDRHDLLDYLSHADNIADSAEGIALCLSYKKTEIPESIQNDIINITNKSVETTEEFLKALREIKNLLETTFSKKKVHEEAEVFNAVAECEREVDHLHGELMKKLYSSKTDPVSIYHLIEFVERVEGLADNAANTTERLRIMLAKIK